MPKLRFPEFQDAGEWEEKLLGDFATIVRGGSPRPIDEYITIDANSFNWLKIGDIDKESKFVTSTQEKVIPAALTKTRQVNPGDLILSNSMSFGRPYILKIKTCIHDGWIAVSKIDKSLDRDYLYYLMMTSTCQTYFTNNAAGSGVQNLNAYIIKLLPVSYPNKKEQQKIADCLSSIDELITAETQKLHTLKTHKKGLMQQMFPAEGETIPKLRFPEFQDAGEWGEKLLKKVFSIFQGFAFSSNDSVPHGIRSLKIADVSIQKMNHYAPSYLPLEHKNKYQKFSIKKGDYVLALTRPILSGELKMAPVDDVFHGALLNQRVGKLVTDQNISFVYYLLQTSKLISDIDKSISGSEPPNLSAQQIEGIKTRIPLKDEQQKIANCLSSLDELISAQTQKLASLKTHKKGLMQQLFPTAEEVAP